MSCNPSSWQARVMHARVKRVPSGSAGGVSVLRRHDVSGRRRSNDRATRVGRGRCRRVSVRVGRGSRAGGLRVGFWVWAQLSGPGPVSFGLIPLGRIGLQKCHFLLFFNSFHSFLFNFFQKHHFLIKTTQKLNLNKYFQHKISQLN